MMNYLDNEIKIIEQKKLEKVINGLECCLAVTKCGICPYNTEKDSWCGNNNQLLEDAFELLKAQEPVEPILDIRHGKSMWRCGSCSTALQPNQMNAKFCFNCGRPVKWE